jgi:Flp pilus assembly protein TadD
MRKVGIVRTISWISMAVAIPAAAWSSGGGGGGGGGMPSASVPQYDPAREYSEGMAAYQAGKYKDAARSFDHVTQVATDQVSGWKMLGLARSNAGDPKGAARAFERALKIDSKPVDTRRDYVLALAHAKMTDKANAELAKLKTRADLCKDGCAEAGALKSAISEIEAALQPTSTEAPAKPVAMASPAPALLTLRDGDSAYLEAVSLINEHRYGEALAALDRAEAAFGPHPDVLTYRGYVWRKLGRLDLAEQNYRAALAIAPTHRGASEYYGELKVIEGDLAGARTLLAAIERQCAFGCAEAEDLRRWIDRGGDPAS